MVPEALEELWRDIRKFDNDHLQGLFADPVDRAAFPSYDDIISHPMDLTTLK